MRNYKLEFDVDDVAESEKLAVVVGTWKYMIGGETKDAGNHISTLKHENGDWKVSWTIWNSTTPREAYIQLLQHMKH